MAVGSASGRHGRGDTTGGKSGFEGTRGNENGGGKSGGGSSLAGGALSREDRLNAAPAPAKAAPSKSAPAPGTTHGKPATGFDKYGMGSAAGMVDAGVSAGDVGRLATGGLNETQGAAVRSQVQDIQDDGLGGLLGLIGLSERIDVDSILGNPADPQSDASWGFDPAGLVGGAAGLALGGLPLGTIAALASNAMGNPAEINLGPDVFGGGAGGAADLASVGRDGRDTGLLAGGAAAQPQQQAQAPAQPGATPSVPDGTARMSGLLSAEDTDYLRGVTTRRPTPAQRFQPGAYTGRLLWDPAEGRMIPAPTV